MNKKMVSLWLVECRDASAPGGWRMLSQIAHSAMTRERARGHREVSLRKNYRAARYNRV